MEYESAQGISAMLLVGLILTSIGGTIGLIGIWGYVVHKLAVPTAIRVIHAHLNWWAVLAYVAALVLPSLSVPSLLGGADSARRRIALIYLVASLIWMVGMVGFYIFASVVIGAVATIAELTLVVTLIVIIYWVIKQGEEWVGPFPRFHLLASLGGLLVGVALGSSLIFAYKYVNPLFYLSTSNLRALPTTHDHLAIIPVATLIYIAVLVRIGVASELIKKFSKLFVAAIILYPVLLALWLFGGSRYIPAIAEAIFYAALIGVIALTALSLGKKQTTLELSLKSVFTYLLVLNAFLIGVGAYLVITKVAPFSAWLYGWFPKDKDWVFFRNIENLHLSPGSWTYTKMITLIGITLLPISTSTKLFLGILAALAPTFNAVGRYTAAIGFPAVGPGALIMAGHPLFVLFQLSSIIVVVYVWKKTKTSIHLAGA
ncbi:MAG: hypothetical protein QXT26_03895 [Thermoproteota archaeon]